MIRRSARATLLAFAALIPFASLHAQSILVNESRKPHTVEVSLVAKRTGIEILPGKITETYAYNGQVPGPRLEAYEGDHVIIHFRNELPEPTTIHWHGLHIPNASDGSPFYPIAPGAKYDYVFDLHAGSAGTYWYHPHPDGNSGWQIAKGLYGAFIVRSRTDPLKGIPERVLVITDNRFRKDGSIDFADPRSAQGGIDFENGREGSDIFVNGKMNPTLTIRAGEVQRWRIINTAAARIFRLSIPGQKLLHVGSDGGLFEKPREVDDIMVSNSERAEVLVRGTGKPGSIAVVQSLPYDRYSPHTRPDDWDKPVELFKLAYSRMPAMKSPVIPARLRFVPKIDTTLAKRTRYFSLQQGFINGKLHDMMRVDETAKLGDVEIWQVENIVGMDHPFHLHGFQFQVIDRNGVPEPFVSWKDTVNVPKHSYVRFIVRLSDFAGKWMYHCHILDHEDHGMMGVLEVN